MATPVSQDEFESGGRRHRTMELIGHRTLTAGNSVPQSPSSYAPLKPLSAHTIQSPNAHAIFRPRPIISSQGIESYSYPEVDFDALDNSWMSGQPLTTGADASYQSVDSTEPTANPGSKESLPDSQAFARLVPPAFDPDVGQTLLDIELFLQILVIRVHSLYQVFPLTRSSNLNHVQHFLTPFVQTLQ
eukprot:Gregarina_sp_Poly_1__7264@NODE_39_length_18147_cov_101_572069_g34_i0_p13_GENE_NODE_39_length_18147_cov_101_572069_g34_i0NODE_39_length_18147_cov_101_572069_g34_i0_p13_ORF_typecomplete_len188_score16_33_NODE_39_length_18147_cov_101_572069_g34_i041174680